ncbi:U-box domain-containing protein 7-like [Nymphaea colorata]|nr:U-box domain-containing protein 7-like [Nymphaea colorata]XP_031476555.1 U-box domain-containing protein 7-like [Nymphaea colorata]XP_031476556.1 U-box domain-containing protein 7-like [Nymphaea colorata]
MEDNDTRTYRPKVHGIMCGELKRIVDRVILVLPRLESARPGFMSGIQSLCSLNLEIEKAKSLIQYCSESSKLYMAITGESIKRRCEIIRMSLCRHLVQVQNMVPIGLASQISEIVNDLKEVKFMLELSEEEAGKAIVAVLLQDTSTSNATEISEMEVFQTAALKLHILSPKARLIERRCLKKLLDKYRGSDQKKENIILFLLHLLKKHGRFVKDQHQESADDQSKELSTTCDCLYDRCRYKGDGTFHAVSCEEFKNHVQCMPPAPDKFRCPLSLEIMHDPVVIASGQTYERAWIQKWFAEGHDICPKTGRKLPHLSVTPNDCLKDLISSWYVKHGIPKEEERIRLTPSTSCHWDGSCSSSASSIDISLEMPNFLAKKKTSRPTDEVDLSHISIGSSCSSFCSDSSSNLSFTTLNYNSFKSSSLGSHRHGLLIKLSSPPLDSQHKAAADIKFLLEEHHDVCNSMLHNGYLEALLSFIKSASELSDLKSQCIGAQVLFSFVKKSRTKVPFLSNDVCDVLVLLLDSGVVQEVLSILQILSDDNYWKSQLIASKVVPSVVKIFESQTGECLASAIKVLYNLSPLSEAQSYLIASRCISKLAPLLSDAKLAGDIIGILHNLVFTEVGRAQIAETSGCISSVAELLEDSCTENQEHAVAVLLSLCSHDTGHCDLVLREGIIPSLVTVSVTGNKNGKEGALKLLKYLRDLRHIYSEEGRPHYMNVRCEMPMRQESLPQERKPVIKSSNFFCKKIGRSSKPESATLR